MADVSFIMESIPAGVSPTREALAKFWAGDPDTFREMVDRYSPRLLGVTRSFARDLDHAHDLLQDSWVRAYEKRRQFTGAGSLLGWLYAIARSVCLGDARRPDRKAPLDESLASGDPADREAEQTELRAALLDAVLELPDRERDIVIHRLIDGDSTRDTAVALGCAEGTVKAGLYHALAKLRPTLEVWRDEVVSRR